VVCVCSCIRIGRCANTDITHQKQPSVRHTSSSMTTVSASSGNRSPPGGDTTSAGNRSLRQGQQQRLTITLVTISTLWVVLSFPYAIIDNGGDSGKFYVAPLTRVVCYLLMYANHAVNFFVYCLLGRKFRTELKRLFGVDTYAMRSVGRHDDQRAIRLMSWRPRLAQQCMPSRCCDDTGEGCEEGEVQGNGKEMNEEG